MILYDTISIIRNHQNSIGTYEGTDIKADRIEEVPKLFGGACFLENPKC